jgi:hypothetical protein
MVVHYNQYNHFNHFNYSNHSNFKKNFFLKMVYQETTTTTYDELFDVNGINLYLILFKIDFIDRF